MDAHLISLSQIADNTLNSADEISRLIEEFQNDPARHLNLGETWAGIHFTLTDEFPIPREEAVKRRMAWNDTSLENVLMGGLPTAYTASLGVARYLQPKQVVHLAKALDGISVMQFVQWYDADWLLENRIQPEIWDQPEAKQELSEKFSKLKHFYQQAAIDNRSLLIYIF